MSMKIYVTITRVADGVVRTLNEDWPDCRMEEYHVSQEDATTDRIQSWWSDGNGSCDCNRHSYFERAGGGADEPISLLIGPDGKTVPLVEGRCISGERYHVKIQNETGAVLYESMSE